MTDVYQPIRDHAQQQLGNFDDRNAYIAAVIGFTELQGMLDSEAAMMAYRIAAYAWDSTPYKVIPHEQLSPAEIPAGAKSPQGILSDADLTIAVARRLRG